MNIEYYITKYKDNPQKIRDLKKLYDNWFDTSCILYNAMSDIVVMCHDRGSDIFEKVSGIKEVALDTIDRANEIGLTNPDLWDCEKRTMAISKMIK